MGAKETFDAVVDIIGKGGDPRRRTKTLTDTVSGGNDPGDKEPKRGRGSVDTEVKLSALVREAGWTGTDATVATAVIQQESGCNPKAANACCHGLAQIHWEAHKSKLGAYGVTKISDLYDPRKNLAYAYDLWKSEGWGPWEGYTDGNYKKYLGKDCTVKAGDSGFVGDAADAAGGAVDGVGEALGVIAGIVKTLLNPSTYFRGGKVVIGAVVLLLGLAAMIFVAISVLSGGGSGKGAVGKAANLIPAGKAIKAVT